MSGEIGERLHRIKNEIEAAAARSHRNAEDITLVCVSKTFSAEMVNEAAESLCAETLPVIFGENYVQEYEAKKPLLKAHAAHLIGHLQSNKVAKAVALFDVIESVDSEKILTLVDAEARKAGRVMPIFIQVNISSDKNKYGFAVDNLARIFSEVAPRCSAIDIRGLMTITEFFENPEDARKDFRALKKIGDEIAMQTGKMLGLSMGMSADFMIAIEEGATHVRVGSAIFGSR